VEEKEKDTKLKLIREKKDSEEIVTKKDKLKS